MKVFDITEDWIRSNFDIEKERDEVCKKSERCVCSLDILDESCTVEEAVERFSREIHYLIEPEARESLVYISHCWDDPSSFCVLNYHYRPETDKEVVGRISRREKSKIRSQEKKQKKDAKERAEYERLKKKFEGAC